MMALTSAAVGLRLRDQICYGKGSLLQKNQAGKYVSGEPKPDSLITSSMPQLLPPQSESYLCP